MLIQNNRRSMQRRNGDVSQAIDKYLQIDDSQHADYGFTSKLV